MFDKKFFLAVFAGVFFGLILSCVRYSFTRSDGKRLFVLYPLSFCKLKRGTYVDFKPFPNDPYLPKVKGITLIKKIACVKGDEIVRKGLKFYCNGKLIAVAVTRTRDGRPIKPWQVEKVVVPDGKFFVAGSDPRSYDSRYFGLISKDQIKACVIPLI